MRITGQIYPITPKIQKSDNNLKNYSSANIGFSHNETKKLPYPAVCYKPMISFKGEYFDNYFPSKILGITEEKLDEILKNTIDNDNKKALLAEYIVDTVAKDQKSMDFINMWKRQVPTLISQGTLAMGEFSAESSIKKIIQTTARSQSSSMLQKFNESNYQTDILKKDGQSAIGGLLSYKLFSLASASPEMYTKIGLYAAAFCVSLASYKLSSTDSKEIQNKQFIDATKSMLKLGVLDPYALLNKIDKNIVNLSSEKEAEYIKWKNNKLQEYRFAKTGYQKDQHNDFSTEEARNVLKIVLSTLKNSAGFNNEQIAAFLDLLAAQYTSVNETKEAQYLLELATSIQKQLVSFDKNNSINKTLYNTYLTLAYLQSENEEHIKSIDTINSAIELAKDLFGEDSDEFFEANMKKLEHIKEQIKHAKAISPYLEIDHMVMDEASEGELLLNWGYEQSDKLMKLKNSINSLNRYNWNYDDFNNYHYHTHWKVNQDSEGHCYYYYHSNDMKSTIATIVNLINKNQRKPQDTLRFLDILNKEPDKNLYDLLKENFSEFGNNIQNNDECIHIRKQFENLLTTDDSAVDKLQSSPECVKRIYLAAELLGMDFDKIDDLVTKKYGENSPERAELYNLKFDYNYKDEEKTIYNKENILSVINDLRKSSEILKSCLGITNNKTLESLAKLGVRSYDYSEILDIIRIIEKNGSPEFKEKHLPKIYVNYAKHWTCSYEFSSSEENKSDAYLERIIAFEKALKSSKKKSPLLIYEYMVYLRKSVYAGIYSGKSRLLPTGETPLLDEMILNSNSENKNSLKKYNKMLYFSSFAESRLKDLIESVPDPFNINQREFLVIQRKHNIPLFYGAEKHYIKTNKKINSLENAAEVYKVK